MPEIHEGPDIVRSAGSGTPIRRVPPWGYGADRNDLRAKGGVVEIIDPSAPTHGGGILIPRYVRVNGVEVGLLTEDGLKVDVSSADAPVVVTLRLLPSQVVVRAEDPADTPATEDDGTEAAPGETEIGTMTIPVYVKAPDITGAASETVTTMLRHLASDGGRA